MPKRRYASKTKPDQGSLLPSNNNSMSIEAEVTTDDKTDETHYTPPLGARVSKGAACTDSSLLSLRPWPLQYHHFLCTVGYCVAAYMATAWFISDNDEESAVIALLLFPVIAAIHALCVLLTFWSSRAGAFLQFAKVVDIRQATHALLQEKDGSAMVCPVIEDEHGYACIKQKRKILWGDTSHTFHKLDFPVDHRFEFYLNSRGHNVHSLVPAVQKFGRNQLEIPLPTWQDLYKEHAVQPFFVFQILCVLLWMMDEYWQYPLITAAMLFALEFVVVQTRLANLSSLRDMTPPEHQVNVYRNGKWVKIGHYELVPGDLISFSRREEEITAMCDMLLLSGSCVVTEAMLTGESTPQMKESIADADPETHLSMRSHSLHIVNAGTTIVQTSPDKHRLNAPDGGCIGYVLRTRFETKQGKLMRTILYSSDRTSANNKETLGFIAFMMVFAIIASGYVLYHGLADAARSRYKLALNCVMILTSVVPPELPMELTLAVNNSLKALRQLGVFCTEPFRIPFAGKVDVCCFDKTGTLTENDIRMVGVAGCGTALELIPPVEISDEATFILAGCHTIVHIGGQQVGDSTELAALQGIQWACKKGDIAVATRGSRKGQKIHVIKRFHFSSDLKRMSCIIGLDHERDTTIWTVSKGAPEVMLHYFASIPAWYTSTYQYYSRRGMRVLALGYKTMAERPSRELHALTREDVEHDLVFAGFIVLESVLKKESLDTIRSIQEAGHATIMITGDNILTASEVARNLGMVDSGKEMLLYDTDEGCWLSMDRAKRIDHNSAALTKEFYEKFELGIDGGGVEQLLVERSNPAVRLSRYLSRVKVWARCSPKQKECIVRELGRLGYTTLMCGDGTNDVGALKKAHVGVALLDIESAPPATSAGKSKEVALTSTRPPAKRSRKPKSHKQIVMFTSSSSHNTDLLRKPVKLKPFDGVAVWRAEYITEALSSPQKYRIRCLALENLPRESSHGRLYVSVLTKSDAGFEEKFCTKQHSDCHSWQNEGFYVSLDRTDTLRLEVNSKSSIIGRKSLLGVRDVKLGFVFNKGKAPKIKSCMHYPIAGVEVLVNLSFDKKRFPSIGRAKLTMGITPCKGIDSPIMDTKLFKKRYNQMRTNAKKNKKKYEQAKKDAAEIISTCELDGVFLSEVGGLSQTNLENLYANTFDSARDEERELETVGEMTSALSDAGCLKAILSEFMGLETSGEAVGEAQALFNALDIDGDGRISFRELVVALGALVNPTDDNRSQRATLIFKAMDINNDGGLSYKELKRWMKTLNLVREIRLTPVYPQGFIKLSIKKFMTTFERQLLMASAVDRGTLSRAIERMRVMWEDLDKETLAHLLSMTYAHLELSQSELISLDAWSDFYSDAVFWAPHHIIGEQVQASLLAFILPKVKAALAALLRDEDDLSSSSSSEDSEADDDFTMTTNPIES